MKVPAREQPFGLFARVPGAGLGAVRPRDVIGVGLSDANSLIKRMAELRELVRHIRDFLCD